MGDPSDEGNPLKSQHHSFQFQPKCSMGRFDASEDPNDTATTRGRPASQCVTTGPTSVRGPIPRVTAHRLFRSSAHSRSTSHVSSDFSVLCSAPRPANLRHLHRVRPRPGGPVIGGSSGLPTIGLCPVPHQSRRAQYTTGAQLRQNTQPRELSSSRVGCMICRGDRGRPANRATRTSRRPTGPRTPGSHHRKHTYPPRMFFTGTGCRAKRISGQGELFKPQSRETDQSNTWPRNPADAT